MKYELNKGEVESLNRIVHFILEFEYDDYVDWCKREDSTGKGHVYYHANELAGKLLEWYELDEKGLERDKKLKDYIDRQDFFEDTFNYEQRIL
jgi:hypothetical protein